MIYTSHLSNICVLFTKIKNMSPFHAFVLATSPVKQEVGLWPSVWLNHSTAHVDQNSQVKLKLSSFLMLWAMNLPYCKCQYIIIRYMCLSKVLAKRDKELEVQDNKTAWTFLSWSIAFLTHNNCTWLLALWTEYNGFPAGVDIMAITNLCMVICLETTYTTTACSLNG